jgi:hypothetical protein
MKTIYKYVIEVEDEQELNLPLGAMILSAAFQGKTLCMWVLVDKDEDYSKKQTVYIYGTGHNIVEENSRFINTVFMDYLVFHVFVRNY